MSITVEKSPVVRADGEYTPQIPGEVWTRLTAPGIHPKALAFYTWMQTKPCGWELGNREQMSNALGGTDKGWSVHIVRQCITSLKRVGLYLVDRVNDLAGHFVTTCRALTMPSSQVTPEVESEEAGPPADIPPLREKKRERHALRLPRLGKPHDPATCPREAAGKPCRDCAAAAAERRPEKSSAATHPAPAPVATVIAAALGATGTECEHGHLPGRCGQCRYRAARG
jgi:hypothetical protein